MLVAQIQDDYQIGLGQMPVPPLPPKGALVRVIGCGLCGSDLDKLVHQKASPGSVLGHEVVGIIEALDDDHPSGWHLGDRIVVAHHVPCGQCHYCLNGSESMCRDFKRTNLTPGGFSQYIALSEGHLAKTAFRVPPHIGSDEASCVEPLACVLRAVRRAGMHLHGSAVVMGMGFIGMMAAQAYRNHHYRVYGIDLNRDRLNLALKKGFVAAAYHPTEDREALEADLAEYTGLGRVDVVFLTVVNTHTLRLALDLVRDGGTVVVFASAAPDTQLDPTPLYFREINLVTSYSPSLTDLREAAEQIFEERIQVKALVSHRLPLSEIREAFELYRSGAAMKVFIDAVNTP